MKLIKGTIIATVLMATFSLTPGTAHAEKSCADRIKAAMERLSFASKEVASIAGAVEIAKEALKNGKKKKCGKKMNRAENMLDKKGL